MLSVNNRLSISCENFNMSLQRCLLFFCSLTAVSALYFHIGETEKKCFIEEIPDETMVVGMFCFVAIFIVGKHVNQADFQR